MNNKFFTVCGLLPIDGKILLVRHTYGTAKDRILLPGGYVQEGELPTAAVEREIYEETGVAAHAASLLAMQYKPDQWCAVFLMEHIAGEPKSDGYENSEVLLLAPREAVERPDITNMSRAVLEAYLRDGDRYNHRGLHKSDYVAPSSDAAHYVLFQNGGRDRNPKAECERAMAAIAEKLTAAGFSQSGNLFYRYQNDKRVAKIIEVQRSQFNSPESYSFTMNVGRITAADVGLLPPSKLTVQLMKTATGNPNLVTRSGTLCYGYDKWYEFSIYMETDADAYTRNVILPDLDKLLSILDAADTTGT